MKVTVITPTLNPREKYIKRVFSALECQTFPLSQWEYLVVDSGSSPPLKGRLDLSWHPCARIIEAPEMRLATSRMRGMELAKGEIIVFVDDDNVLATDYLENAISVMDEHPFIGVLGSFMEAEFHGTVYPWMHEFLPILGAMQYLPGPHSDLCYAMGKGGGPWVPAGAGMILRKVVADEYCRQVQIDPDKLSLGRVGQGLLGSEDVDLAYTAIDMQMAIGRSTRTRLIHLIPETRLNETYMVRLLYASNYATAQLLVRRGWKKVVALPHENVWGRMKKKMFVWRKISSEERCWRAFSKGYQDGLAGAQFDNQFR